MLTLPIQIPMIQSFLRLDTQSLIPFLDDPCNLFRTQVLDFALLASDQITVMLGHMYQDVHASGSLSFVQSIGVTEGGEGGSEFDEFVGYVVIGRRVGKEGFALSQREGYQIYESVNEGVDSVEGFEVVGVDGEEANEGEKRAPEFGPVVCCD